MRETIPVFSSCNMTAHTQPFQLKLETCCRSRYFLCSAAGQVLLCAQLFIASCVHC